MRIRLLTLRFLPFFLGRINDTPRHDAYNSTDIFTTAWHTYDSPRRVVPASDQHPFTDGILFFFFARQEKETRRAVMWRRLPRFICMQGVEHKQTWEQFFPSDFQFFSLFFLSSSFSPLRDELWENPWTPDRTLASCMFRGLWVVSDVREMRETQWNFVKLKLFYEL